MAESQTEEYTHRILSRAKSLYPTLMIGPPPALDATDNDRRRAYSAALCRTSANVGIPFMSMIDELAECQTWAKAQAAGDGSHPSAHGYQKWAELVIQWPEWWYRPGREARHN